LLENILPSHVSRSWCDPTRKLRAWPVNARATASYVPGAAPTARPRSDATEPSESRLARLENGLENKFRDRLLGNFLVTRLAVRDAVGIVLVLSVLASLLLLSVTGSARRSHSDQDARVTQDGYRTKPRLMFRAAVGAFVLAIGT